MTSAEVAAYVWGTSIVLALIAVVPTIVFTVAWFRTRRIQELRPTSLVRTVRVQGNLRRFLREQEVRPGLLATVLVDGDGVTLLRGPSGEKTLAFVEWARIADLNPQYRVASYLPGSVLLSLTKGPEDLNLAFVYGPFGLRTADDDELDRVVLEMDVLSDGAGR
jgi:hypothetical protein